MPYFPLNICPFPWKERIWIPSNAWFFGPTQSTTLNGISTDWAVFQNSQLLPMDRKTTLACTNSCFTSYHCNVAKMQKITAFWENVNIAFGLKITKNAMKISQYCGQSILHVHYIASGLRGQYIHVCGHQSFCTAHPGFLEKDLKAVGRRRKRWWLTKARLEMCQLSHSQLTVGGRPWSIRRVFTDPNCHKHGCIMHREWRGNVSKLWCTVVYNSNEHNSSDIINDKTNHLAHRLPNSKNTFCKQHTRRPL